MLQIPFHKDHEEPKECQVFIALTGSPKYIRNKLLSLLNEMDVHKGVMPNDNSTGGGKGSCHVIRTCWNDEAETNHGIRKV